MIFTTLNRTLDKNHITFIYIIHITLYSHVQVKAEDPDSDEVYEEDFDDYEEDFEEIEFETIAESRARLKSENNIDFPQKSKNDRQKWSCYPPTHWRCS